LIEVQRLTKRYGKHTAIENLSFTVGKGEIVGFLGPNGAGKTTTMNIITGYISASEGSAVVAGYDILEHPREVKRAIGYLPEAPPLYPDMTVEEYLSFAARIKGVERGNRRGKLDSVVDRVRINDVRGRLIKNLSKGYRQRVGLAQALIADPEVLILDEPTIGLDPKQIVEIRNLMRDLGRERTVILSSHILPEVTAVCRRVLIINQGRIVAEDTIDNLSAGLSGPRRLNVRVAGGEHDVLAVCRALPAVKTVKCTGSLEAGTVELYIEAAEDRDIRKILFRSFAERDLPILMMRSADANLEDVFLRLTTEERREPNHD